MIRTTDTLPVKLTPAYLMDDDIQDLRTELYERSFYSPVYLRIEHDPGHPKDPYTLRVFYGNIYLGDIRKRFLDKDMTEPVERFCFRRDRLKKVTLVYDKGKLTLIKKGAENTKKIA